MRGGTLAMQAEATENADAGPENDGTNEICPPASEKMIFESLRALIATIVPFV